VASGLKGAADAFEHARVMRAMTQLDLTGEFAMATPEMAASARRWAWISLGLSLVDMAGFASGARASARLASVMASKDVEAVLRFNRATLAEAAERLGMRESDLVRQLSRATGAEREALLGRMRTALTPAVGGGRFRFLGWGDAVTTGELHDLRMALLARTDDVPAVGQAVRRLGYQIDDTMIATIKRYNFDSPGLAFARDNYEAWTRIAAGKGTIGDVRYVIHEAEEVGRLQAVQRRTGFDFLGAGWDRMTPVQRARWRKEFANDIAAGSDLLQRGHYYSAHGHALEREFGYMAEQAHRLSGGEVRVSAVEAAAIDMTVSGREAREFIMRDGVPLAMHADIGRWQARAGQVVTLSPEIRTALGSPGIYRAVSAISSGNAMRAQAVAQGLASPTVTEFLAIIRSLPASF
jgi:hypothetical protein